MYICICICCCFKRKTDAQENIFLNLFTICSSCKRKFVVCPFVDKETSGSYPFTMRAVSKYDYSFTSVPHYPNLLPNICWMTLETISLLTIYWVQKPSNVVKRLKLISPNNKYRSPAFAQSSCPHYPGCRSHWLASFLGTPEYRFLHIIKTVMH